MTLQRWRAVLGYGGLVPFVSLALLVWLTPQPVARFLVAMQLAYGAMILCFVGAVHWGRSLGPDTGRVGGATLAAKAGRQLQLLVDEAVVRGDAAFAAADSRCASGVHRGHAVSPAMVGSRILNCTQFNCNLAIVAAE